MNTIVIKTDELYKMAKDLRADTFSEVTISYQPLDAPDEEDSEDDEGTYPAALSFSCTEGNMSIDFGIIEEEISPETENNLPFQDITISIDEFHKKIKQLRKSSWKQVRINYKEDEDEDGKFSALSFQPYSSKNPHNSIELGQINSLYNL